mmetsp:Transcript_75287/g.172428  ORF Transcript_75287/g.172428 Transcript_75287/m.172428 type:complete len:231 (+) Transcript_75287:234-926(+)
MNNQSNGNCPETDRRSSLEASLGPTSESQLYSTRTMSSTENPRSPSSAAMPFGEKCWVLTLSLLNTPRCSSATASTVGLGVAVTEVFRVSFFPAASTWAGSPLPGSSPAVLHALSSAGDAIRGGSGAKSGSRSEASGPLGVSCRAVDLGVFASLASFFRTNWTDSTAGTRSKINPSDRMQPHSRSSRLRTVTSSGEMSTLAQTARSNPSQSMGWPRASRRRSTLARSTAR